MIRQASSSKNARTAPAKALTRAATGAALAIALGCGLVPATGVSGLVPVQVWAETASATIPSANGIWSFDTQGELNKNTGASASLNLALANLSGSLSDVEAFGTSLRFNDKQGAHTATVANAINNQRDFSISLWIKADKNLEHGAKTAILQLGGDGKTLLYQMQDGTFRTYISGSEQSLGSDKHRGEWEHLVLVKNKNTKTISLYLNGAKIGSHQWSNNLTAGTFDLILGQHKNAGDMTRFQGFMDEVKVWNNTALTDAQVKDLYDSYDAAKQELESVTIRGDVQALVQKAESLYAKSDGSQAYADLKSAIDAARALLDGTGSTAEALKEARRNLEARIGDIYAIGLTVSIDPGTVTRVIDDGIFGINHRYAFNGYGSFDSKTMKVKDDFAKLYDEAGFGSIRYPGGTISNLFNWKETLGDKDQRTPQIHGFYNNTGQGGIAPNFGISEIGTFAQDHGSEIIYVYALGRGDANDAADLVEFLNAEVGDNPNGGTDWAKVRAEQGRPRPYNVRYFEIGNEMNQGGDDGTASQQYWTSNVAGGALEGYVNGGTASFTDQYAVVRGNWNATASRSTGEPNQEFGMRYALVKRDSKAKDYNAFTAVKVDSVAVKVGDETWTKVADLKTAGATDKVYQLDEKTGYFTFGDGEHGAIPEAGKQVKVTYSVDRDGFVQISESMRQTMEQINAGRSKAGKSAGEIHIYSSFETEGFINRIHELGKDHLYDGMAIHPYSGDPGNNDNPEAFYLEALRLGDNKVNHVRELTNKMRQVSGDLNKVPVISEYGIFRSTNALVRSQVHALYIARQIMDYIELGSPYIQKHCLVDWYSSGADSLGPTQQAVIQAVPVEGESDKTTGEGTFTFFKTPSASVFEMLDDGFGFNVLSTSTNSVEALSNGVSPYDVIASSDAEGNYYVAITNLKTDSNGSFKLNLTGVDLTGRTLEIRTLAGDALGAENSPAEPNKVQIESSTKTADAAQPVIDLKPHSFTIVKVAAAKNPVEPPVNPNPPVDPVPPAQDKVETETDAQGNTITTQTHQDGTKTVTIKTKENTSITAQVNQNGSATSVTVKVSHSDAKNGSVALPLAHLDIVGGAPDSDDTQGTTGKDACKITIDLPSSVSADNTVVLDASIKKDKDDKTVDPGVIFARVNADGTQTVLPKTAFDADSIKIEVVDDDTLAIANAAKEFNDVEHSDWFAPEVIPFASARGIINGVEMGNGERQFRGNATTSRGMFVAMLHNLELAPKAQGNGGFDDIAGDSWFKDAASWGAQSEIVEGYGDGSLFGGDDPVTREQMAVFLMRYANFLGLDTSQRAEISFPDAKEISEYAKDSMSWAIAEGLFSGNSVTGELNPSDDATRAEVATVLMRFINGMYA